MHLLAKGGGGGNQSIFIPHSVQLTHPLKFQQNSLQKSEASLLKGIQAQNASGSGLGMGSHCHSNKLVVALVVAMSSNRHAVCHHCNSIGVANPFSLVLSMAIM